MQFIKTKAPGLLTKPMRGFAPWIKPLIERIEALTQHDETSVHVYKLYIDNVNYHVFTD